MLSQSSYHFIAYTHCSYRNRDGVVNPDVNLLQAGNFFSSSAQSSFYNALAFALNGSTTYSAIATKQIYTMFIDPKLSVNPNLEYAQIVRGKGQSQGSYMGVLDFRGLIKGVNAVEVRCFSSLARIGVNSYVE